MTVKNPLADRFPDDFIFGVATSAYQIEGATKEDGRGPSIWDAFSNMPGRVYQGHNGDVACDHYHLWENDLDLIQALGVDAYRFSIAWPRIIPNGVGAVNQAGIDFYDRLIDGMLERGLQVFPTLYHWDLPLNLAGYGGWTDRNTADAFAQYAGVITKHLGDRFDSITTFNEPWCACHLSHLIGIHAPGEKSITATMRAVHTMNLAHGLGVQAIRAERADVPVGIVLNAASLSANTDEPADIAATERQFQFDNGVFFGPIFNGAYDNDLQEELGDMLEIQEGDLQTIQQPLDFWGFNYYTPVKVVDKTTTNSVFPHAKLCAPPKDCEKTDIGWEINAKGLSALLTQVYERYELPPVYITENGACINTDIDAHGNVHDVARTKYLASHIEECANVIDSGIDLRGYFAWSLMDNFEWAEGYKMRFGLVHVDFDTQVRTIKDSGYWYSELSQTHRAKADANDSSSNQVTADTDFDLSN